MQTQQRFVPDYSTQSSILNLPDNYEQFVEEIDKAKGNNVTEYGCNSHISNTSPRSCRKKQLTVSCSLDRKHRNHSKVIFRMLLYLHFWGNVNSKKSAYYSCRIYLISGTHA